MISLEEAPKISIQAQGTMPPEGEGVISLNSGQGPMATSLPEEVVKEKSEKYDFALASRSPGATELYRAIQDGAEDSIRRSLAASADLDKMRQKQRVLQEETSAGFPVTPEEIAFVTTLAQPDAEENPNTFFEKEYAKRYSTLALGNYIFSSEGDDRENRHKVIDAAETLITKQEIVKNVLDGLQAQWDSAGLGSNIRDYAKTFIPFWSTTHMMNEVEGMDNGALTMGNNVIQQMEYLSFLPPDEFENEFRKTVEGIAYTSPVDAYNFARAYMQYSNSDSYLDTAFQALDALDVGATALSLGIAGGRGIARRLGRMGGDTPMSPSRVDPIGPNDPDLGEALNPDQYFNAGSSGPSVRNRTAEDVDDLNDIKTAAKQAVKANASLLAKPEDLAAAAGRVDEAAMAMVQKRQIKRIESEGIDIDPTTIVKNNFDDLDTIVPSIYNVKGILNGPSRLARKFADEIETRISSSASKINEALDIVAGVRTNERGLQTAIQLAKQSIRSEFKDINSNILDIGYTRPEQHRANVSQVYIDIGGPNGALPSSAKSAYNIAKDVYKIHPDDFQIIPQGDKFFIRVTRDVDETSGSVRETFLDNGTGYESPSFFGKLFEGLRARTPDDVIGDHVRGGRKLSVFGTEQFQALLKEAAAPLAKLSKSELNDLQRILEVNRKEIGPDGTEGNFYRSLGELELSYLRNLNRLPTADEAAGYFNAVQLSDADYMSRVYSLYRDFARQGVREWKLRIPGSAEETTPWFKGKPLDNIPWDDGHDAGIWINNVDRNVATYYRKNLNKNQLRAEVEDMVANRGYKIIQVAQPTMRDSHKLNDLLPTGKNKGIGPNINFIVTKDVETRKMAMNNILPYRAGMHKVYSTKYSVAQAQVEEINGVPVYRGDIPAFNANSAAEAKKYAKHMEEARIRLMAAERNPSVLNRFNQYVSDNLPYTPQEFRDMFFEASARTAGSQPRFRLNSPFTDLNRGEEGLSKLRNVRGKDLKQLFPELSEGTGSPYDLYSQSNKMFHQERGPDVPTIMDGPNNVPVLGGAELLDPLGTLNNSMLNITKMRGLEDTAIMSSEWWVANFADTLDVPRETLELNPMYHLLNPVYKEGADWDKISAAKATRAALVNFLKVRNPHMEIMEWVQTKVVDSVYNVAGSKAAGKLSATDMFTTTDPAAYLRAAAFHPTMGFFNIVQFPLQAQGAMHAIAVSGSPKRAWNAMTAYQLQRFMGATENKAIFDRIGDIAAKMGWSKADFLESYDEMRKTGFYNVGKDTAWLDDQLNPKVIQSKAGWALDKSAFFFTEGERLYRMVSWNISFQEFRQANPTKKITNLDRAAILRRASDLNLNMARDSNAAWQQGVLSVPTQFFGYQARLTEQVLGKRLTNAEKARALGMYSLFYGIPAGVGVVTTINASDWLQRTALEHGFNVDSGVLDTAFNGLISNAIEAITGRQYNVADRYGPLGLDFYSDALSGDKTAIEILFGASGSIAGGLVASSYSLLQNQIISVFKSEEDGVVPVTIDNYIDVAKNVSSFNNTYRAYVAWKTGEIISKKEGFQTHGDKFDALMVSLGLTPKDLQNAYLFAQSNRNRGEILKNSIKEIKMHYGRAFKETDEKIRMKHLAKASGIIKRENFSSIEMQQIMREIGPDVLSFSESVRQDWVRKAPGGEHMERQKLINENSKSNRSQ